MDITNIRPSLVVLFLVLTQANAQDFWQQTNGPYGGFINGLAVHPNGGVFVATLDGGVFSSNDYGLSWTETNNGLTQLDVRSLLVAGNLNLFAGTNYDPFGGIFRSTDDGQTWTQLAGSPTNVSIQTLAVDSGGILFAGTDIAGVFRSTDNGNSWESVNNGLPLVPILSLATNSLGQIFAGTEGGGVFLSVDGGDTWINALLARQQVYALLAELSGDILAGTDSGVYRYNGVVWTGPALAGYSVRSLVSSDSTVFAGTDFAGIWRSTNSGTSWLPVNLNVSDASIRSLGLYQQYVYAGTDGRGVFVSNNGGTGWSRASNGLRNGFINAVGRDTAGAILATMNGEGIFRTSDGGETWVTMNNGLTSLDVSSVVTAPGGRMYAGTRSGGGVFFTDDNGQSWNEVSNGLPSEVDILSLTVNALSDVIAGTSLAGIFRLPNGGSTWVQVDNVVSNANVNAFVVQGDTVFAAVDSGGVYRSTDHGSSWAFVNTGLTNFSVNAVTVSSVTGTVFAATSGGGLHRSTDGGESWTAVDGAYANSLSCIVNTDGVVYASSGGGLVRRSTNDGLSWATVSSGLKGQNISSFVLDGDGYLYSGTMGGGVYRSVNVTTRPSPPTLLSPANGASNVPVDVLLEWRSPKGVMPGSMYSIQVAEDSFFTRMRVTATTPDTFHSISLGYDSTYFWRVNASNINGVGAYARPYRFTTVVTPPPSPVLVLPGDGGTNQPTSMTFIWNPSSRASFYHIQLSLTTAFASIVVEDTLTDTLVTISNLAHNTQYFWHVRAGNAGGVSPFSAPRSFTTIGTTSAGDTILFPGEPTASTDYRLFSLPGIQTSTASTFLQGAQGTDWRLFRDNGAPTNYLVELPSSFTFVTGEGYWLIAKGSRSFVNQNWLMPPLDQDGTYAIPLDSGWNIIGNPFTVDVPWQSVLSANGLSLSTQLIAYQGAAGYSYTATMLKPFSGYYFFNGTGIQSLKIPYPFGSPSPPPVVSPITWKIEMVFESGMNVDTDNYIGVAPSASMGVDAMDARKPPLIFDQGFLYFSRPDWDSRYSRFRSDFRSEVGEGQVWEFEVANPQKTDGTIRFFGLEGIPREYDIALVNIYNSVPVDLRQTHDYAFISVETLTPFKLIVGNPSFVQRQLSASIPATFSLEQNYPNPFNPATTIRFTVPRSEWVRLEIFSVLGQRVKVLTDGNLAPASYSIAWNGTDDSGIHVAGGIYFCRLLAGGKVIQVRKMALIR